MGSICSCLGGSDDLEDRNSISYHGEFCYCCKCIFDSIHRKYAVIFNQGRRLISSGHGISNQSDLKHGEDVATDKSAKLGSLIANLIPSFNTVEVSIDEDVCPTCLEEYTDENPKIVTKCSHGYHLSCIYAWLERSGTCPICCRVMVFEELL